MIKKTKAPASTSVIALAVVALIAAGCGKTEQKGGSEGSKNGGSTGGDDPSPGNGTANPAKTPNGNAKATANTGVFAAWCAKAAETKAVKEQMGDVFGKLCNGGQPTEAFTKTLIAAAYNGSGEPQLLDRKLKTVGKDTTADFIVGIKIPTTARVHFDKVGPLGGDTAALGQIAAAQGATSAAEIKKTYKAGDDKNLVRGWQFHTRTEKDLVIIKVVQDSDNEHMQYDFGESDGAFMYAQYIISPKEGIKAYNVLTAAIQVGGEAYLLSAAHTVVTSPIAVGQIAEGKVIEAAVAVVKSQYKAAAKAK